MVGDTNDVIWGSQRLLANIETIIRDNKDKDYVNLIPWRVCTIHKTYTERPAVSQSLS